MQGKMLYQQENGREGARAFSWGARAAIFLLGFFGWLLVRLVGATLRCQVEGWANFDGLVQQKKRIIYCFWHNQILPATYFWRFKDIVVIASQHFDGEVIAATIKRLGYGSARGSSSRGAVAALLELKRCVEQGRDVAFTADGPRGPVYKAKPGPTWLARRTGAAILPFHIEPEAFWVFNSWDGFRIPKPFSRTLVKIGQPLTVSLKQDEEQAAAQVQEELDRIRRKCELHWRAAPPMPKTPKRS